LSVTSTTVARLSKKRHMYLRSVSPCSCFTIARSMRVPDAIARDHLAKCHEPGPWVGCHGEAALERSGTVNGSNPRPEDEGVAAVEGDSWLDED
jgi:hypothetical protein